MTTIYSLNESLLPDKSSRRSSARLASWSLAALTLLLVTTLAGCAAGNSGYSQRDDFTPPERKYVIGPSDVLSISVWNHEEMNRTVTVRPDGKLSFSLIGDITAAGLTPLELQTAIEEALRNYMTVVPGEVTVVVDEVRSYKVSVMGEVRQPGRFEFQNQVSILDALAQAGGLTEFASGGKILIFRMYQGKKQKIEFDYDRLVNSKTSGEPVLLFPGDIVLVP